jgi:hypothetical protein
MNWKGFGRRQQWRILKYYPGIRLEGLRKTTKTLNLDGRSAGRDLNPRSPEYKAGVLTTRPRHSVTSYKESTQRISYPHSIPFDRYEGKELITIVK